RPHLRYLATLTPTQQQELQSSTGLPFTRMSLEQQQQFLSLAFRYSRRQGAPQVGLEELTTATLRVSYTQPGGFGCSLREGPGRGVERTPLELFLVQERTREAALQAARRIDAQVAESQIVPTEPGLMFVYAWGSPATRAHTLAMRVRSDGGATIW